MWQRGGGPKIQIGNLSHQPQVCPHPLLYQDKGEDQQAVVKGKHQPHASPDLVTPIQICLWLTSKRFALCASITKVTLMTLWEMTLISVEDVQNSSTRFLSWL